MRKRIHESEMALFYECIQKCARKRDTADIVREGIYQHLETSCSWTEN